MCPLRHRYPCHQLDLPDYASRTHRRLSATFSWFLLLFRPIWVGTPLSVACVFSEGFAIVPCYPLKSYLLLLRLLLLLRQAIGSLRMLERFPAHL